MVLCGAIPPQSVMSMAGMMELTWGNARRHWGLSAGVLAGRWTCGICSRLGGVVCNRLPWTWERSTEKSGN